MTDQSNEREQQSLFRRRFNDRLVSVFTPILVLSLGGIGSIAYTDYERGIRVEEKLNQTRVRLAKLEYEVCEIARELREEKKKCAIPGDQN